MAIRSHSSEYLKVLVGMIEPHGNLAYRIFYIHDTVITREIIVKNASGSNDYIFFSVIYRSEGFEFACFCEFIVYDEC